MVAYVGEGRAAGSGMQKEVEGSGDGEKGVFDK